MDAATLHVLCTIGFEDPVLLKQDDDGHDSRGCYIRVRHSVSHSARPGQRVMRNRPLYKAGRVYS